MYVANESGQAFTTGCVPLVIALVRRFVDHKKSGLPMRAKYIQACEDDVTRNLDNSPTFCNSSLLN